MPETSREYIENGKKIKETEGYYEVVTKDNEGEAHIHRLKKHSTTTQPLPPEVTEADFIRQAAPTVIRPSRAKKIQRSDELTLCMGDAQIGFRGEEPFHDERAMSLAQIAIASMKPDNIVFTGDMIDLPAQSKFAQREDWQDSTQKSIDRYHNFLAETRANAPDARISVVHGNHEMRMVDSLRRDAAHLMGLKRANASHEMAVMTLPFLVRYDELEIEAVTGYPNGRIWLEDNLQVAHGTNVKKGGSNAAKYLKENEQSIIYGHTHRMELAYRTIATRLGSRAIVAASPGCLARIDGAVPGYSYTVDDMNQTVLHAEDWQQGVLAVEHNPRLHDVQTGRITEVGIKLHGETYTTQEK